MTEIVIADVTVAQERTGQSDTGLTLQGFQNICEEIRNQPDWRTEADRCAQYYDGNQHDQEILEALRIRGQDPITVNLVRPTIDVVLGMEAKTRRDWRVTADDDAHQDVAEALSVRMAEAERETRADRACSDGYASQVKSGIGWVEIGRNHDPFRYPYRVSAVHRREMFWDWTSQEPDLSDANYLVRRRWFDIEQVVLWFPQHEGVLRAAVGGWPSDLQINRFPEDVTLAHAFDQEVSSSLYDYEWRDTIRRRVCLFETRYRTYARGWVITLPNGDPVELNVRNPVHVALLANGAVKPRMAVYSKINFAVYCGPHKLHDRPMESRDFPYVMFPGFRESLTAKPYGLIRSMLSPQDEINARRQKMMWLLSAKRLQIDSDALDKRYNDISQVLEELNRPDAVIVLDPQRTNRQGAVAIDSNLGETQQQYQIMKDSTQMIQAVAGVYQQMLGKEGSTTSGVAIASLVEQGAMTLAELNDNYAYSRRLVGERLLDLIREDMNGQRVDIVVGESAKKRTISLNMPALDEQVGLQYLKNDTSKARVRVALEDVPSTPAYRQQTMLMLGEVMKSLPGDIQMLLAPLWLESTELPKRKEIADLVRKRLGMDGDGEQADPEKMQLMQQIQQLVQQAQAREAQSAQLVADLKAQVEAANRAVSDRSAEIKNEADRIAGEEAAKAEELAVERARIEAEERVKMAAVEADKLRAEAERIRAEAEASRFVGGERVRMAELNRQAPESASKDDANVIELIGKVAGEVASLKAAVEKDAKEDAGEAKQAQPMVFNFHVDARPTAGKKTVVLQTDAEGNPVGAEITPENVEGEE